MVGGETWSRMASAVNTASTAPAAPSRCPVMDLVEFTAALAVSPSSRFTAFVSAISPSGLRYRAR